jgi:hypothetical protein
MAAVEQLLAALRGTGPVAAAELAGRLGVSQPTLSRLVRAAGERVRRLGKARATRYALARPVPGLGDRLPLFQIDEHGASRPFGMLHLLASDHCWLEREIGGGTVFAGLPPLAWDMCPQGFLGRGFTTRCPDLDLPRRLADWNDDHRLTALARRGEDCVGDLVLGAESLDRWIVSDPKIYARRLYPQLARTALTQQPGSSAGGEQPKFAARVRAGHVLVKFAHDEAGAASARWRDLLICECVALDVVRAAGVPAAKATWFDREGTRFLEVARFDRVGERGRRGVVSLGALDTQHYGMRDSWTKAALRMLAEPCGSVDPADLRRLRWLDVFGELIGNSDRHFGNVSFFTDHAERPTLQLTPVYDMLPMAFAPQGTSIVERPFAPRPPSADTLDVWHDAAKHALAYRRRLAKTPDLSRGFRTIASRCGSDIATLIQRHAATAPGD